MCGGCMSGGWAELPKLPPGDCLVTVKDADENTIACQFVSGQFVLDGVEVPGVVFWRLRIE